MSCSHAADLPPVVVAPGRITQVLIDVLSNAIQAAPEGGTVLVSTREGNGEVAVVISKSEVPPLTGEQIAHAFDPFHADKRGNSSLGLFISRSIVERHGGTLTVGNLPEEAGVAFTITLPGAGMQVGQEEAA